MGSHRKRNYHVPCTEVGIGVRWLRVICFVNCKVRRARYLRLRCAAFSITNSPTGSSRFHLHPGGRLPVRLPFLTSWLTTSPTTVRTCRGERWRLRRSVNRLIAILTRPLAVFVKLRSYPPSLRRLSPSIIGAIRARRNHTRVRTHANGPSKAKFSVFFRLGRVIFQRTRPLRSVFNKTRREKCSTIVIAAATIDAVNAGSRERKLVWSPTDEYNAITLFLFPAVGENSTSYEKRIFHLQGYLEVLSVPRNVEARQLTSHKFSLKQRMTQPYFA